MSPAPSLHLLKLCVGADSVADLEDWQRRHMALSRSPHPRHVTRMWPRRAESLVAGGSLYWVIKGFVLARQRIVALEAETGVDGVSRCAIVLDPAVVRTEAQPRRPFQGWRYLALSDAPADIGASEAGEALPPSLQAALSDLGVRSRRAQCA